MSADRWIVRRGVPVEPRVQGRVWWVDKPAGYGLHVWGGQFHTFPEAIAHATKEANREH